MIRKIIKIDEDKCSGCGICVNDCHEGAIDIVNGKAKLMRENFCDGFGDCLSGCPMGAISFEEREAPEYDEEAVKAAQNIKKAKESTQTECPGSTAVRFKKDETKSPGEKVCKSISELRQWPVQIKLIPITAEFYDDCDILIAADCTAYAYASMHNDIMKDKITLIGCPKLDSADYSEKLTEIIKSNNIKSITTARMEVPCCKGLQTAAEQAVLKSGKTIPCKVIVISCDGKILQQ